MGVGNLRRESWYGECSGIADALPQHLDHRNRSTTN